MLLKSKSSPAIAIGYDPGVRLGTRPMPPPKFAAQAAATYSGIYCRPNLQNGGTIPASGPLCTCPDIWISGTRPIANFQTVLATSASYATASVDTIQQGQANYIYVRGMNGALLPLSTQVQLFASPAGIILWPALWKQRPIPTDIDYQPPNPPVYASNIDNLAAGAIGVAQNAFVWSDPEPPPPGSDHYCLISWMNNASNPFPDAPGPLELSHLIANNLGFGFRNVSLQSGSSPTVQLVTQIEIPVSVPPGSRQYYILIFPSGFPSGWQVSLSCSQTDTKGNPIAIPQQIIPPPPAKYLGIYAWLDPGFSATVTINCYQNGAEPATNATLQMQVMYLAEPQEIKRALALGIIDFAMSRALESAFRGFGIAPSPVCPLGFDTLMLI
jgi:hypothetical protein